MQVRVHHLVWYRLFPALINLDLGPIYLRRTPIPGFRNPHNFKLPRAILDQECDGYTHDAIIITRNIGHLAYFNGIIVVVMRVLILIPLIVAFYEI